MTAVMIVVREKKKIAVTINDLIDCFAANKQSAVVGYFDKLVYIQHNNFSALGFKDGIFFKFG